MSGGGHIAQSYLPENSKQADMGWGQLFSGSMPWAQGAAGQIIPNLYQDAQSIQNNPYAAQMQMGANNAGAWATGTGAPMMQAGAQALQQQGGQLGAGITGAMQQGNDPQNALYNQTSQQTLDQQNAINAMSGVSGSPYSAGLDAQNAQNFNLAWGNNQLNRMSQGDQTASGLSGASQGAFGGAGGLAQGATSLGATGAMLPYTTGNMPGQAGLSAWNQAAGGVNQALAPAEGMMGQANAYQNVEQGAASQNDAAQKQNYDQTMAMYQALGSLFMGPSSPLGGMGGGGGGGGGGSSGGGMDMSSIMSMLPMLMAMF